MVSTSDRLGAGSEGQSLLDTNREIELEIVSNSWLSLTSPGGFDAMMRSWARKIDADAHHEVEGGLVDQVILRQFEPIHSLLSAQSEFRQADPLERETLATPNPVMILSPDGTVAAAANGGEEFFGVALGRRAGRGWLAEGSEDDFEILRRSILGKGNACYAILRATGADGYEALVEAYGLDVDEYTGTFTVVRSLELDWKPEVGDRLERAYGLTSSEIEICRLIFRLRDLDAVAEQRSVAIDTVRTQVKRIFAKLGLHSKADLIKLMAMLCARTTVTAGRSDLNWSDPLGREQILIRPDGRKLAYTWVGAEHGREVLFIHGEMPMFYLEPTTQSSLQQAAVKLVCLSMPGHGSSDPPPNGVKQLDDGIAAIESLMRHLGHKRMPMAASYSGMTYPMFFGRQATPLATAILLIGLPWNLTPETFRQLPTNQKTLSQLAVRAPRILDLVCRLGWKMMLREGPDFYLSRAFSGSKADLATASRADIQPYLRAACRHLMAQGHSAFAREVLKGAEARPAKVLSDLAVPLHWLAPDQVITWRTENLAVARRMSPQITVETVSHAGELLPYQRPDVFVRAMADLASDAPASRFSQHDDFGGVMPFE